MLTHAVNIILESVPNISVLPQEIILFTRNGYCVTSKINTVAYVRFVFSLIILYAVVMC